MEPIRIKGLDRVIRNLSGLGRRLGPAVERGLLKSANMIMRESLKIVPVQTGFLKSSWDIRKHGSGLRAKVLAGYFGVYYAPYVHEIPNPPHAHGQEFNIKHAEELARAGLWKSSLKTHRTTWKPYGFAGTAAGGMFPRKPKEQYKFLERPARERTSDVLRIVRQEIRAKMK